MKSHAEASMKGGELRARIASEAEGFLVGGTGGL